MDDTYYRMKSSLKIKWFTHNQRVFDAELYRKNDFLPSHNEYNIVNR